MSIFSPSKQTASVTPGAAAPVLHVQAGETTLTSRPRTRQKRMKSGKILPDGTIFTATSPLPNLFAPLSENQMFTIRQTTTKTALTSSTSLTTFASWNFQLSDLSQASSWTSVFDQYRFDLVELWITPRIGLVTSNTANTGQLVTVLDYDDSNTLASFTAGLAYPSAVVGNGMEGQHRRIVPHIAVAGYAGSFTGYTNVAAPWIDAATPSMQHYGVKTAWSATDVVYNMDVLVRYTITFRNVF